MKIPVDMIAGSTHKTNNYGDLEITEFTNSRNVKVKFVATGFETVASAGKIRNGVVKDLFHPNVHGVGYIGVGDHNVSESGKTTKCYYTWKSMLERCYDPKYHARRPTRIGCTVDPIWHNFQCFAEWFSENYVDGYDLDKDIKRKGGKVYSPDNSLFVPSSLNSLFNDHGRARGNYPQGVSYRNAAKKFEARLSYNGKKKHLGFFDTPEEASEVYQDARKAKIEAIIESNIYGDLTQYLHQHI